MLVICPKCFTQYVISDEIKVPEGQKFHCSACGNYFTLRSERQTGFYGDDASSEDEEIPTVSAVMNEAGGQYEEMVSVPEINSSSTESDEKIDEKNESNKVNENINPPLSESNQNVKRADPIFSDADSLALLANETPQDSDRLDALPEAFKPVETKKKKTSVISALFWLCVAGGICYGSLYLLTQYPFMEKTEDFIVSKLDKNYVSKEKKTVSVKKNNKINQAEDLQPTSKTSQQIQNNSGDQSQSLPPIKSEKPTAGEEKVQSSAKESAQETQPADTKSVSKSESAVQPVPQVAMNQQMAQAPKPTRLMAQQAKAQQSAQEEQSQAAEQPQAATSQSEQAQQPVSEQVQQPTSLNSENSSEQAKTAAKLLDEQLEQGAAEENLENEVAALAAEHHLSRAILSEASATSESEPTSSENNAQTAEESPSKDQATSEPVKVSEQPMPQSLQPSSSAQQPQQQPTPQPTLQPSQEAQPQAAVPQSEQAQQSAPTPQQALQQSIQAPMQQQALTTETENNPVFTVGEPIKAKQLNTTEANRILKIQDIAYEISQNEAGVLRLMIKGVVVNTELTKVVIPQLKAVVYDQNDMPVARKRIILSQPEIDGNSVQAFFSSVVPAPEQVSHVEVVFDE